MQADIKIHGKKILPHKKISKVKLERIISTICIYINSPDTKFGAITFINDAALRKQLLPLANNNVKIREAVYLILFYTWETVEPNETFLPGQGCPLTIQPKKDKKKVISSTKLPGASFILKVQNTYQAAGAGLKAAANERIDASLIEDLHYNKVDKLLQLKKKGLRSIAFLTLGNSCN